MTTPHPYGTPQAQRLEARFSEFPARYDGSPYANLMLRMRRITSWLTRAEQELFESEEPDPDAAFVFYWMAFNAAYGEKIPGKIEWEIFNDYLGRLLFYDNKENVIYNALRNSISRDVVLSFIDNQYLYWRFWRHHNGERGYNKWRCDFASENQKVRDALDRTVPGGKVLPGGPQDDRRFVLEKLFSRMYMFRNQMIHGATTYKSLVARAQVEDGARIMALLVPLFIELMMNKSDVDWGVPEYPPIFEDRRK